MASTDQAGRAVILDEQDRWVPLFFYFLQFLLQQRFRPKNDAVFLQFRAEEPGTDRLVECFFQIMQHLFKTEAGTVDQYNSVLYSAEKAGSAGNGAMVGFTVNRLVFFIHIY